LAALARELAVRLDALARAGLVRGYREADTESAFLRGRLRAADQLRDAATRAFPDTFHATESVFDLDTPWNRVPAATGRELLRRSDLPADARRELAAALVPLDAVPDAPLADADFDAATREPRAAGYNEVLRLCGAIRDGLRAATGQGTGAFLLDLGRAFEEHVTRSLAAALGQRPGWSVEVQPRFPLADGGEPVVLQPDVVVRRRGAVRAVLDAKWKRLAGGPDPDDLHQILAYAAVTGAEHVALVYPGTRSGRCSLAVPGGRVRVTLFRLRVVGPLTDCEASVRRLVRATCGRG
jgi:5-methylcytosine-specific restriction enzyme subunit McrC